LQSYEQPKKNFKRSNTDVDRYIANQKTNSSDQENFIYVAQFDKEDPYDLKLIEYNRIKQIELKEYYTLRYSSYAAKRGSATS